MPIKGGATVISHDQVAGAGVAGIYNRYGYGPEKQKALEGGGLGSAK